VLTLEARGEVSRELDRGRSTARLHLLTPAHDARQFPEKGCLGSELGTQPAVLGSHGDQCDLRPNERGEQ
jgi:hypothetical protein